MSRRVQVTREILGDLVRRVRQTIKDLQLEEDKLLLLVDWYEPDLGKVMKNGQIIRDNIDSEKP